MTTTPTNEYEALRSKINTLLPERLKLEWGCEVERYSGEAADTLCSITSSGTEHAVRLIRFPNCTHYDFLATTAEVESWKILGTPLTITDVLRALIAAGQFQDDGHCALVHIDGKWEIGNLEWNGLAHTLPPIVLSLPLSAPENAAACAAVLRLLENK